MLHPFLDYTLEGFRCFRNRTEFREPRHVNIICGANNSGKSTLLLPLRRVTAPHNLPEVPPFRDDILVADRNMLEQLRFQVEDISHGCGQFRVIFHQAVGCDYFIEGSKNFGTPLMEFGCPGEPPDKLTDAKKAEMRAAIEEHGRLIQYIPATRRTKPILHSTEAKLLGESIFDGSLVLPKLLGYANWPREGTEDFDGRNPKLKNIESKMSIILGQEVQIHPLPVERDIELTIDGRHVALSRCGAGIEQLIIFAVALVEYPTSLLLIEEPENFLHPTLQRRVMLELLQREGDSVITTHSNHLLDIRGNDIAYYRTFLDSEEPQSAAVERIHTERKYKAIWDLGVRPSSLFESNASIWVEGPSDAIYIRQWLSLLPSARGLIEGIHYTFAFHAGALLDKFFADPEGGSQVLDRKNIVDFFALHPNFFIVADSDGTQPKQIRHPYLQRIVDQPSVANVLWVTHGKEIENYIPIWVLERWLSEKARPRRQVRKHPAQVDERFVPFWKTMNTLASEDMWTNYPNKVEFADWAGRQLGSPPEDAADPLDVFDLRTKLEQLVQFVRNASGEDRESINSNAAELVQPALHA